MRYAGGGVGHYRVTLTDTPANANEIQEDFAVDDDVTAGPPRPTDLELEERIIASVAEAAGLEEVEEAERENHCSDSEGEEDDEENPDEDDLGAEDGEGGFLDAEGDEGYAAL